MKLWDPLNRNKVRYLAHRGLSAQAPENSLAALRLAASEEGFYGVEFDIWESRAEKDPPFFLVMHDPDTKRMCGQAADIRALTRSEAGRFTIEQGSRVRKYRGQRIPTLEESLDVIWAHSKGAIPVIELKHRLSRRGLQYLFDRIGDHEAVIISFHFDAISDASRLAEEKGLGQQIRTMYLLKKLPSRDVPEMIRKLTRAKIDAISLYYPAIKRRTVRKFHSSGIEVSAWTVPDRRTARRLIWMGVDYITSNGVLF